jgi:hypothetical protein
MQLNTKIALPTAPCRIFVAFWFFQTCLVKVQPGVRHEAVRLGALVEVIAKMRILLLGVLVFTRDSVNFRTIAAFDAVVFEAAWHSFDLEYQKELIDRLPLVVPRLKSAY